MLKSILVFSIIILFFNSNSFARKTLYIQAESVDTMYHASIDSDNQGYSGSGFLNFDNEVGSYAVWNIYLENDASADINIRFSNGSGITRHLDIILNEKAVVRNLNFEATSDWSSWKDKILPLSMTSGINTIKIISSNEEGGPNIDKLELSSDQFPANFKPIAINDLIPLSEGSSILFNPLENDYDYEMDTLSIRLLTQPSQGTVTSTESNYFQFNANNGFVGNDSLYYEITDGELLDTAMVVFNIGEFDWSVEIAESTLKRYTPASFGDWHYANALFLEGLFRLYKRTGEQKYYDFIHDWTNLHINENGSIDHSVTRLDDILGGIIALRMYYETGEEKYKKAAEYIRNSLDSYPRTNDGGFWHMKKKTGELWLDGMYMSMPFLARYGKMFDEGDYCYTEVINQFIIYASHLRDEETGILYHAYDEDGSASWASPPANHSPEFWGRSIGWYVMGLIEVLEIIPEDTKGRADLIGILQKALTGLIDLQDEETGLWFQVPNKGAMSDNWLESSCSIMYTYAIKRAVEKGYIEQKYTLNALKAYAGIQTMIYIGEDKLSYLTEICEGTGVGDYTFYINRQRLVNNNHGLGAFIIMNELLAHGQLSLDSLNRDTADPATPLPNNQSHMELFPNPVKDFAKLVFQLKENGPVSINIFDLNGRMLKPLIDQTFFYGQYAVNIDFSSIKPGIYYLKLSSDKQRPEIVKFIKQ